MEVRQHFPKATTMSNDGMQRTSRVAAQHSTVPDPDASLQNIRRPRKGTLPGCLKTPLNEPLETLHQSRMRTTPGVASERPPRTVRSGALIPGTLAGAVIGLILALSRESFTADFGSDVEVIMTTGLVLGGSLVGTVSAVLFEAHDATGHRFKAACYFVLFLAALILLALTALATATRIVS